MKYIVYITETHFYRYEVEAGDKEEAEYLTKKFFTISSDRKEHYLMKKIRTWAKKARKEDL